MARQNGLASIVQKRVRPRKSYALLVRSTNHTYNGLGFIRARFCNRRITNIIIVVEQFYRKSPCSSGRIPTCSQYSLGRRATIFSIILPAYANSEIPLLLLHSVRSFVLWSTMMMVYIHCCGCSFSSKYKRRYRAVFSAGRNHR